MLNHAYASIFYSLKAKVRYMKDKMLLLTTCFGTIQKSHKNLRALQSFPWCFRTLLRKLEVGTEPGHLPSKGAAQR